MIFLAKKSVFPLSVNLKKNLEKVKLAGQLTSV